jgi:hypothetical protein
MPFRKQLKSSQPQAFGKNALLQKQFERQYNRLERERKSTQRRIQITEEKCVHSVYNLLQEAELYEQEKKQKQEEERLKRIEKESKNPVFYYEIENEYVPKQPETKLVRGRPMTASVSTRRSGTQRKELRIRPSSATPALCCENGDPPASTTTNAQRISSAESSHSRLSSASSYSSVQKENVFDSRPSSADNGTLSANPGTNLKLWQLSHRRNSERKLSAVRRHSSARSVRSVDEPPEPFPEPETINTFARPKTADRYRRRRPDDELSEYWNRRVANIIRKWDLRDSDQYTKDVKVVKDMGPPPYRKLNSRTGQVERFIQKYSGKYRSLLRQSTSPALLDNKQKRSEKISRQEVASINADAARYKKNTKYLLSKSREIKLYVENLPGVDKSQNLLNSPNL